MASQCGSRRPDARISSQALVGNFPVPYQGFAAPGQDEFIQVGLNRLPVVAAVKKRVAELLASIPLVDQSFIVTMERIILAYTSVSLLFEEAPEVERAVYSSLLFRALPARVHPESSAEGRDDALSYLAEFAVRSLSRLRL